MAGLITIWRGNSISYVIRGLERGFVVKLFTEYPNNRQTHIPKQVVRKNVNLGDIATPILNRKNAKTIRKVAPLMVSSITWQVFYSAPMSQFWRKG